MRPSRPNTARHCRPRPTRSPSASSVVSLRPTRPSVSLLCLEVRGGVLVAGAALPHGGAAAVVALLLVPVAPLLALAGLPALGAPAVLAVFLVEGALAGADHPLGDALAPLALLLVEGALAGAGLPLGDALAPLALLLVQTALVGRGHEHVAAVLFVLAPELRLLEPHPVVGELGVGRGHGLGDGAVAGFAEAAVGRGHALEDNEGEGALDDLHGAGMLREGRGTRARG